MTIALGIRLRKDSKLSVQHHEQLRLAEWDPYIFTIMLLQFFLLLLSAAIGSG